MLSVMSCCTEVRCRHVATTNPRVHLTFNEYDFRHRKVLEILRARPRNQTELTVNAILHYISCPEAEVEFGKDTIRKVVREVITEMQANGELGSTPSGACAKEQELDFGDVMSAFRK